LDAHGTARPQTHQPAVDKAHMNMAFVSGAQTLAYVDGRADFHRARLLAELRADLAAYENHLAHQRVGTHLDGEEKKTHYGKQECRAQSLEHNRPLSESGRARISRTRNGSVCL